MHSCDICYESSDDEFVNFCPGNHYFHKFCLFKWYAKNDTCPYCREQSSFYKDATDEQLIFMGKNFITYNNLDFMLLKIVEHRKVPQDIFTAALCFHGFDELLHNLINSSMVEITDMKKILYVAIFHNKITVIESILLEHDYELMEDEFIFLINSPFNNNENLVSLLLICAKFKPSSQYILEGIYSGYYQGLSKNINRLINAYYHKHN